MHNALHRTLADHGRLTIKRVVTGVFKTFVSCQNVAKNLVVVGTTNLGSTCLFFHSSLIAAMDAFRKLPLVLEEEDDINAVVGPPAAPMLAFTHTLPGRPMVLRFQRTISRQIHLGTVPLSLLNAANASSASSGVPPQRGSSPCLVTPRETARHDPSLNALRPTPHAPPRSYRDVALTPPCPTPMPPKTLKPISITSGCFRCLALDHTVKDCHDPVRCRVYGGSGHRSYSCSMAF